MSSDAAESEVNREVRRQRYIAHICIDCGEAPHSAGRPRCERCHRVYVRWNGRR